MDDISKDPIVLCKDLCMEIALYLDDRSLGSLEQTNKEILMILRSDVFYQRKIGKNQLWQFYRQYNEYANGKFIALLLESNWHDDHIKELRDLLKECKINERLKIKFDYYPLDLVLFDKSTSNYKRRIEIAKILIAHGFNRITTENLTKYKFNDIKIEAFKMSRVRILSFIDKNKVHINFV